MFLAAIPWAFIYLVMVGTLSVYVVIESLIGWLKR